MLTATDGRFKLIVEQDDYPPNPREEEESLVGNMFCWHPRYSLGDSHSFEDPIAFLESLLYEILGGQQAVEDYLDKVENQLPAGAYKGKLFDVYYDAVQKYVGSKLIMLPLYLYDHSGITMSTKQFSCRWDSGQVGWIWAYKTDLLKNTGLKNTSDMIKLLESEVVDYDSYLRGDCYFYSLYELSECDCCHHVSEVLIDNCYGFWGGHYLEDIKESLSSDYTHLVEMLKDHI